jgi:hypothetical protein
MARPTEPVSLFTAETVRLSPASTSRSFASNPEDAVTDSEPVVPTVPVSAALVGVSLTGVMLMVAVEAAELGVPRIVSTMT